MSNPSAASEKKWYQKLKMPHTYVILTTILIFVTILTHIIPAGEYQRIEDPTSGKQIVVPGSYEQIEVEAPGFFDIFLSLQEGYVDAADIMFLIIFAYGFVYVLTKNGTMDAALGVMVKKVGNKVQLLIPITMITLGLLSSLLGIFEEVYGLFPVLVGMFIALGYDALVGGAIIYLGIAVGFAAALTNPYSIGIAQDIVGLPMFSGLGLRIAIFIVFEVVTITYVMLYAKKVKRDPTKSVLYGVELEGIPTKTLDALTDVHLSGRQKICLLIFLVTVATLLYGTIVLKWYINEIAALFLMAMIASGIASGYSTTEICKTFIESTRSMVSTMLVVGFTRGILLMMKSGCITDTIVFYLVSVLENTSKYVSAYGMLILQNIIKLFITGSSSQATITMPIMSPTAELIGLSKQIAVLAYQFGNGFAEIFWPTSCALGCGLMGVPINKWYKFVAPLFGIFVILEIVFMTIAVSIGYC